MTTSKENEKNSIEYIVGCLDRAHKELLDVIYYGEEYLKEHKKVKDKILDLNLMLVNLIDKMDKKKVE